MGITIPFEWVQKVREALKRQETRRAKRKEQKEEDEGGESKSDVQSLGINYEWVVTFRGLKEKTKAQMLRGVEPKAELGEHRL